MKRFQIIILLLSVFFISENSFGQKKAHHAAKHKNTNHHGHHAVKRSRYRPSKVVAYRPIWAPHKEINRRWVYFPKQRLYWDNWRQMYYYNNGKRWIAVNKLPSKYDSVDFSNEEFNELSEDNDDDDEIYLQEVK